MPVRKLTLRTERLADLGADELRRVAGGTHFCDVTHEAACNIKQPPTTPPIDCLSLDDRWCTATCI